MRKKLILTRHSKGVIFLHSNYHYQGDIKADDIIIKDNIIVDGNVTCNSLRVGELVCKDIISGNKESVYFFTELETLQKEKLGRLRVEKTLTIGKMVIIKVLIGTK